jgi:hypothetical protein
LSNHWQAAGWEDYDPASMGRRSRQSEPQRPPAARVEHERPGAVLKGPPITISCECGARAHAAYGERWACERCGRRYDTRRIPAEQYRQIRRTQLRFRMLPIGLGLFVAAAAILFTLTGAVLSVFFLLPIAMTGWFVLLRPIHRRRYREAIGDLPHWDLRAE